MNKSDKNQPDSFCPSHQMIGQIPEQTIKNFMIRALYTLIIMSFSLQMACYSNIAQPRTPQEMEEMSGIIFEGTVISVELIKIDEIPVPGNTPIIINNYAALVKMSLLLKGTLEDTDIIVHFFEIKDARYRGEKGTMLHPGDKNRFYMDHNSIGKKADGGIIFTISGRRNLIHTDSRQKIANSVLNNEVESSMLDQDIARITTTGEINVPVYKDSDVESSKKYSFPTKAKSLWAWLLIIIFVVVLLVIVKITIRK